MSLKDQPIIGVTCGTGSSWQVDGASYRSYAAAVERFGAKCVPIDAERKYSVSDCDGILITGGWDVHPDLYERMPGDENLPAAELIIKYKMTCDDVRDSVDIPATAEAINAQKPFLGICRGFQVVNIVLAKKLVPDIPSCVPNALPHAATESASESHEITIEPDSLMEKLYGGCKITINSRHHQGVTADMVPDCIRATGISPDGVVEAMEMRNYGFGVAVQWHPERSADLYIYEPSGALFEAFVKACEGRF